MARTSDGTTELCRLLMVRFKSFGIIKSLSNIRTWENGMLLAIERGNAIDSGGRGVSQATAHAEGLMSSNVHAATA